MQTGKNAMESMKETASNVAASARSGLEKTKATLQGAGEKTTSKSQLEKDMAEQRKEDRKADAELRKQETRDQNAAQREVNTATAAERHTYSTTRGPGSTTGPHQMSALPGHGSGEPAGRVVEGTVQSHPIGKSTGVSTRSSAAHNTKAGGGTNTGGYGTGGAYTG